jgi:hypothetical protein
VATSPLGCSVRAGRVVNYSPGTSETSHESRDWSRTRIYGLNRRPTGFPVAARRVVRLARLEQLNQAFGEPSETLIELRVPVLVSSMLDPGGRADAGRDSRGPDSILHDGEGHNPVDYLVAEGLEVDPYSGGGPLLDGVQSAHSWIRRRIDHGSVSFPGDVVLRSDEFDRASSFESHSSKRVLS